MELITYLGLLIVSLGFLLKSSDWFIDSAEEIGLSLGISPFIIGVTIVAFGTSLPELATSIAAVLDDESSIVIANVIGSNITNIALVLGFVSIIAKQVDLEYDIWHIDMPFLWGSAFLLGLAIWDLHFSLFEAILFLVGIVIFLAYSFKTDDDSTDEPVEKASLKSYGLLILGGVFVWLSADYTIEAITKLSELAGISSDIIALTGVALGTSLPEVMVSLSAAKKGKTSIAVGNVLGSNIFNTFVVMSIPSFFGSLAISPFILQSSLPIFIVVTILFGVMAKNQKITRWEGLLLLMVYSYFLVEQFKGVGL